ncbi:MAG: hypothetical protein QXN22_08190 [Thermofilaceae archaeon]
MRILHIWNTAGVASIIAKYMDRLFGTKSLVIHRAAFDPYGFTTYGELWNCGAKSFALRSLLKARNFDIIHVHYFDKIVPYLKLLYPDKPIILHYWGDDIRGKWREKQKYWEKADAVLYAAPDLLGEGAPKHAIYVPCPVDTEIFYPRPVKPKPNSAFHFSYNADDLATDYAKRYGLELTIYDRKKHGPIPHLKLPEILCQYEYYIDVKRSCGRLIHGIGKTGREALACGLKVITWEGKIIEGLPRENYPEEVASRVFAIYKSILSSKN